VARQEQRAKVVALLRRVQPDLATDADTTFVLRDEKQYTGFSPEHLFRDGYASITICMWILCGMNLMLYYFLFNWTPTLLASANIPLTKAALFTSVIQIGGLLGGWTIGYLTDKFGYAPVAALPFLGVIVVGSIGYLVNVSEPLLIAVLFLSGLSVLGFNYATNAVAGMVYPTAFRSNGSGWCFAVARAGSITGPLLGAMLISMHVSVQHLYVLAAIPYLICCPVAVIFVGIYRRRFLAVPSGAVAAGTQAATAASPREA
jgi:AAHS family 4-hydroxybenzoate transporter-like MFS transporter